MPTKKELKQRQAIPLFLLGKTDTEVAEAIGVSRQTIWKWRHEEDFRSRDCRGRRRVACAAHRRHIGTREEKHFRNVRSA